MYIRRRQYFWIFYPPPCPHLIQIYKTHTTSLLYLLFWTPWSPSIGEIIKVWYLAALGGAGRLGDAERLLQRSQLPVDDVRVEVGVHVEVELVPAHKVAQLALPQRALVPHARGRPHPLPQQRHGGLVVDSQVHRQSGQDMYAEYHLSSINPQ